MGRTPIKRKREALIVLGTLALGSVGNFVFNKVEVAGFFWFVGLIFLVDFIFTFGCLAKRGKKLRYTLEAFVLIIIYTFSYILFLHPEYRIQHASLLTGDLHARRKWSKRNEPPYPVFCIGLGKNCPVQLLWTGIPNLPEIQLSQKDMYMNIQNGSDEFLVSTIVRDYEGNLVVEVDQNKWRVYPPYCSDKNYTQDTLEVKDSRGRVVLQLRITSARVEFQAEWNDQFGTGMRWRTSPDEKHPGAVMYIWRSKDKQQEYDQYALDPVFRYPSHEHWSEYLASTDP